jgi:hypothetical protein
MLVFSPPLVQIVIPQQVGRQPNLTFRIPSQPTAAKAGLESIMAAQPAVIVIQLIFPLPLAPSAMTVIILVVVIDAG